MTNGNQVFDINDIWDFIQTKDFVEYYLGDGAYIKINKNDNHLFIYECPLYGGDLDLIKIFDLNNINKDIFDGFIKNIK
jgi:hypothetical protein